MTTAVATMLDAALRYADLGYAVFPCVPGNKSPITEHGLLDATTEPDRIERWWTERPSANIAIATDGLLVIDIDGPENGWLAEQPDRQLDLASAPVSLTPGGGRHLFFRQPAGRSYRNSVGRVAERVDVRAGGGYVLVAPSVVLGKPYRWQAGELDDTPEQLPEPPPWLLEILDAACGPASGPSASSSAGANPIPEGRRNAALASLAGAMRRVGMTGPEIAAALQRVNADRCRPPLRAPEVERIAESIARYEPDAVSVAVAERHYEQDLSRPATAEPRCVKALLAEFPMLRPPVITGLLRRGETMNVISAPKLGKSWLVLDLAMAVATGRRWLGLYDTTRADVLIIDNELHGETSAHRIPRVAAARKIGMDEIARALWIENLRGRLQDIFSLGPYFESLEPGRFGLIVLDAFYRFMPRGGDENDNGTMANIYNRIDAFADRLGCSFVLIHHTTKGNQSGKSITDVGAGAGSQSRATDTHLVLRHHEQAGAVVLDAAVRSWPPITPVCLSWDFPVWHPAPDLDPSDLRTERSRKKKETPAKSSEPKPDPWTVERFVEVFISAEPASKAQIREASKEEPGLSWRRVADLLEIAESQGLIHRWRVGSAHRVLYATTPQPAAEEGNS
ncbi:MAG: hypothetical protein D6738_08585 [Acidobacteria bacterium]|nr:MAG: hypothetical protein D6738_08585 [Acidobacteriota bacterium]